MQTCSAGAPLVGSETILGDGIFKWNYTECSSGFDTRDLLELTAMRVLASCPPKEGTRAITI